mgnify:CR=1 FL=1
MSGSVENNTTLYQIEGKVLSVPLIDNTLTKTGRSADAKAVGDQVARLDERLDNVDPHFAKNVQYDNSSSGLDAIDTQGAIDEIKNGIDEMHTDLNNNFFGTHNKPRNFYKGDGSATSRKIEIGGVGGAVIIYSNNASDINICIVTGVGAVAFNVGGTTRETKYMSSAITYKDGIISMATAEDCVNKANVNYYYQVL